MNPPDIIDLCSDEETEDVNGKDAKPVLLSDNFREKPSSETALVKFSCREFSIKQEIEERRSSNSGSCATDQGSSSTNENCLPSSSFCSPVPLCRQFWSSGDYDVGQATLPICQNGINHLRIHPRFLHSNATSHKWVFGAIAELLDNAVDEVQNGATSVKIDKFTVPRNGSPALLVQDNGGGMDLGCLRRCMSFGFSEKQSGSSIGQYGNGFKTSTMRLGSDVIVFSRCRRQRVWTQSVGLLSYTFLKQTGCDDIIVPMVDYEYDKVTSSFKRLHRYGHKQFSSNLSVILKWSPFTTEAELLNQFDEIGDSGTRIIIFNLWLNDNGDMELDFCSNMKDIMITGAQKQVRRSTHESKSTHEYLAVQHLFSLRAYVSILYLHMPENFRIMLRGEIVMHHSIASNLMYRECVMYKPQVGGKIEGSVVTTIGFAEGAPNVNVHGFNVYHRNRLILPFWKVASNSYGKGRGVVGVLEANFIKPTHDKQDFEKSTLYQKLENRLKDMTYEYWDLHCHLVGYNNKKMAITVAPAGSVCHFPGAPVVLHPTSDILSNNTLPGLQAPMARNTGEAFKQSIKLFSNLPVKRKHESPFTGNKISKVCHLSNADQYASHTMQSDCGSGQNQAFDTKTILLENRRLHAECMESEKMQKQLTLKAQNLRDELRKVQEASMKLLAELKEMSDVKIENS